MTDLFQNLNEAQLQAVKHTNGPALVIAGAGSGKTRVLTCRIANLLQQGVNPRSILALTFTNKAAKEMKERIATLADEQKVRGIWMGTFHSIFSRILRQESESLGYPATFTIYDTADSKSLISSIVKEMQLDPAIYKTGEILSRISYAKNNLLTWQAYENNASMRSLDQSTKKPQLFDIYKTYSLRCKRAGSMDFDDLLLNTNILFRDFPNILAKFQEAYQYILVDEYQDTNYSQYLIVKKLAEHHKNICVVGDDAQSIYSFRGARIENILSFKRDYPEHKIFKLEQNYRSTQLIVNAANSIISKNKNQIHKTVWSENEVGEKIRVIETLTDHEEAFAVIDSIINTRILHQASFNDFAILYRTNAQSRVFEENLRKKNIPYKIYGNLSFYQRKEIKDVLSYLKMVINPNDDEAFKRVVNYPARGIGDTTLQRLQEAANRNNVSLWTVITTSENFPSDINKGTATKLFGFANLIRGFITSLYSLNAYDMAMTVVQSAGIIADLKTEQTVENLSRIENIEELLNGIRDAMEQSEEDEYTLEQYLENVSLLTDQDVNKDEPTDKVSLMTVHSAKGLEFSYVFIVGVEENLFPSMMSATSDQDVEEERRLFYVAVTRARKQASLSYAMSRYRWGSPVDCRPSRFIKEIDANFLDYPEESVMNNDNTRQPLKKLQLQPADRHSPPKPIIPSVQNRKPTDPNFKPDDPQLLQEGLRVEHQSFGTGVIMSIEGVLPDAKALVCFDDAGEKKLLLKFARLKILQE